MIFILLYCFSTKEVYVCLFECMYVCLHVCACTSLSLGVAEMLHRKWNKRWFRIVVYVCTTYAMRDIYIIYNLIFGSVKFRRISHIINAFKWRTHAPSVVTQLIFLTRIYTDFRIHEQLNDRNKRKTFGMLSDFETGVRCIQRNDVSYTKLLVWTQCRWESHYIFIFPLRIVTRIGTNSLLSHRVQVGILHKPAKIVWSFISFIF